MIKALRELDKQRLDYVTRYFERRGHVPVRFSFTELASFAEYYRSMDAAECSLDEIDETISRFFSVKERDLLYRIGSIGRGASTTELRRDVKNATLSTARFVESALVQYEQETRPGFMQRMFGRNKNDKNYLRNG